MLRQLCFATLFASALCAPSSKVDDKLRQILNRGGVADVVVIFSEDINYVLQEIEPMRFATRGAKVTTMMAELNSLRENTQRNVLNILQSRAINHESLWINNRIYINSANAELAETIAALHEVSEVRQQIVIKIDNPFTSQNSTILAEWNIEIIEADQAWSLPGGNNGQGVVVSNIDTGVRYTHEALHNNYRRSYGWYDPYNRTPDPTDLNGHGTHTMGTIAGSNGIGVAPGAQWIACSGCAGDECTEFGLSACGQWITCPTLANGTLPNCEMAPDLVSNSWGGDQGSNWYNSIINAWRSAGIIPIFAQGNDGPDCETALSPGDNTNVIGVGATTISDNVASFSSRGPSVEGALKPEVSAPGADVRSAWIADDSAYVGGSGTSMACPHVAGAVALLLSQNSNLSYAQVKNYLQNNTDRNLGAAPPCGDIPPGFPNNIYGYGRINARRALAAAISEQN